jgi:hypothetical protein
MIAEKVKNSQALETNKPYKRQFQRHLRLYRKHCFILLELRVIQITDSRLKNVLVINYSQTGQLADITAQVIAPLEAAGHWVHLETLVPETPFPWPWPFVDFIDAFPECVQLDAPPLKPLGIPADKRFDLVILTYQVWYLSPSLPMTAFLLSPEGRQLIAGKPVVTLVACRNMWLSAQATMQRLIAEAGGQLRDHIAFTDRGHALATFITTPRWVLTGRHNRFFGLPPAGVAPAEIRQASRFGRALADALDRDEEKSGNPMLLGLRACTVNPRLALSEKAGLRAFRVWSRLIRAFGQRGQWRRRPLLLLFTLYLVTLIVTVVPLSLLIQSLLSPLLKPRLDRLRAELELPSGSQDFNLKKYEQ